MSTIAAVLRKRKNAQGKFPIVIRITKNRKPAYITTGQAIDEKHWDSKQRKVKKSHPNSVRLNNLINRKVAELNEELIKADTDSENQEESKEIVKKFRNNSGESFFAFVENYLQIIKKTKHGRYLTESSHLKTIQIFAGQDMTFKEITPDFLRKFEAYLLNEKKASESTVANILIFIRLIFNRAIEDNSIPVEQKHYPFGRGKITIKIPEGKKIGLTKDELDRLINVKLKPNSIEFHARSTWLTLFYFAGMRISDAINLKWSDFRDGRLYYSMSKNGKLDSVKIVEQAKEILSYYEAEKDNHNDYVFPHLKGVNQNDSYDLYIKGRYAIRRINNALRRIAKKAEIDKTLTTHIARHTFGNMAGDKISIQVLQKLYRHSSITTTIKYQRHFMSKHSDDALDKVLGGG